MCMYLKIKQGILKHPTKAEQQIKERRNADIVMNFANNIFFLLILLCTKL